MNVLTMECPDCGREYHAPIHDARYACGTFLCDCGTTLQWVVKRPPAAILHSRHVPVMEG